MRIKKYEHPHIELILLEETGDIITASSGLNVEGGGDGTIIPMSEEGF